MKYLVHMVVRLPRDLDATTVDDLKTREKALALDLQRSGVWPHLWRVVGQYANYSVFDVGSNDELHELLSSLPLFPYMEIDVTPLAVHPSDQICTLSLTDRDVQHLNQAGFMSFSPPNVERMMAR